MNKHTHTHTRFSPSYLSFSRYPLFVLLVRLFSGLCYLIHAEDESHNVIWGMKAAAEESPHPPPTPLCLHIRGHIHNSAFAPSCLLPSAISFLLMLALAGLITTAHAQNPGSPAAHVRNDGSAAQSDLQMVLFECCPCCGVTIYMTN